MTRRFIVSDLLAALSCSCVLEWGRAFGEYWAVVSRFVGREDIVMVVDTTVTQKA